MGLLEPRNQIKRDIMVEMTVTTPEEWRVSCFEELGFSNSEAKALANVKTTDYIITKGSRKKYETPLHHLKVQKMIEAGQTHADVLDLLLPL